MGYDFTKIYNSPLRYQQQVSLQFIKQNITLVDDIIIDAPPGTGKSRISYMISVDQSLNKYRDDDHAVGSYILTTSKNLQSQYLKDFGQLSSKHMPSMCQCKSAQNYNCRCHPQFNCLRVKTMRKIMGKSRPSWTYQCKGNCVYDARKQRLFGKCNKDGIITKAPNIAGVTNYKYIISMWAYVRGVVNKRTMLVLDQAHNLQRQLMSFVQVDFTRNFITKRMGFSDKVLSYGRQKFIKFIQSQYRVILSQKIQGLKSMLNEQGDFAKKADVLKMHQKYDRHLCKVNRFLSQQRRDPKNWVYQLEQDTIYFRPIHVDKYRSDSLFSISKKRLHMSATIGNPKQYAKSLGLKDYKFLSLSSPFRKQNRKIFFVPCGKMTRDNIDNTLPTMVQKINQIVDSYKNDKGIIHSFTYKITQKIKDGRDFQDRMLTHSGRQDRVQALKDHLQSKQPTVLLSPSLFQGIDLRDDLSRFQIIAKIPYPNLGDQRIKIRCKQDYVWYVNERIKSIIQAYGRSVRSKEDHRDTFILDSSFQDLLMRHGKLFPKWFLQRLQ